MLGRDLTVSKPVDRTHALADVVERNMQNIVKVVVWQ